MFGRFVLRRKPLFLLIPSLFLLMFYCYCRKAKTPEAPCTAAVEEPGATPTPEVLNLALTTSVQVQGAKAILLKRNPSRLRALVQEMQGFCDLWEGDLKRAEQSDSDNTKLQQVYDLLEGNEGKL
jgi:hypothetical protein